MDGINQIDLITQRVLAIHIKNLTDELGRTQAELEQARHRIAEQQKASPPVKTRRR